MKGKPVGDEDAATKSGVAKRTARIMPKPKAPLARVENHMLNGITDDALPISSANSSQHGPI